MGTKDEPRQDSFAYRKHVAVAVARLLGSPFSEPTLAAQKSLLLTASVTLLLAAKLIALKSIDSKFELNIDSPLIVKLAAIALTGYLLTQYVLHARTDWLIAQVRGWSPLSQLEEVRTAVRAADLARVAATKQRIEERTQLAVKLKAESEEEEPETYERLLDLSRDGLAAFQELASTTKEIEDVERVSLAAEHLARQRFWVELIFPIGYSAMVVVASLWLTLASAW